MVLVLKSALHCLGADDKRIIVGVSSGITLQLLLSGSLNCNKEDSTHLQGRTLNARIHEHIRNCKKALSIVNRFDSPYKSYHMTGSLPSGMTMEDYYLFVRKNMYCMLAGKKKKDQEGIPSSSLLDSHDESDMPTTWLFPGFYAFILMGPIVPTSLLCYRAKLLMELPSSSSASSSITMDSSSTSSVAILGKKGKAAGTGRTSARKAALNRKQHLSEGFEAERGFITNQRLRIAGIAQSRALSGMMSNGERQRAKGQIIRIQERRVKRQKELIEAKQFLIANTEANDPKRIFMMQELIDLVHNKLQVLSDELDAAKESAIDDAMKMTSDSASTAQECADFIDLTIEQMMRGNEKMPPHYLQYKKPRMDDELSSVEGWVQYC